MGQGLMLPDWRNRLHAYLRKVDRIPFHWGSHSCLTFVTGAAAEMIGFDPWLEYRQKIATMRRGHVLRYMVDYGGDLQGALDKAMSAVGAVQRRSFGVGDVVLANIDGLDTCGLCVGRHCAFAGKDRLVMLKPDVKASWSLKCHQ